MWWNNNNNNGGMSSSSSSRWMAHAFVTSPSRCTMPRYSQKGIEDGLLQEEEEWEEVGDSFGSGFIMLDDLNWRVEKMRLEERNRRRFLKAGPAFLPYDECRKWVQSWGKRWTNKKDWEDWIAMGEKRNSYIPSQPEMYYSKLGKWISWEHFLGVDDKGARGSSSGGGDEK
jgi:hypothetical protein